MQLMKTSLYYQMVTYPVYYSVMMRKGFFDLKELSTFRSIDTDYKGTLHLMRD